MSDIRIIFSTTRTTEKSFTTIADAVACLVKHGYTRVSGDGDARVYTRLYKDNGKGSFARINTTSTPNAWLDIVQQVAERSAK
jgi:hypothetical protein